MISAAPRASLAGPVAKRLAERAERLTRPFRDLYPFESRFIAHGEVHQHYLDEGPSSPEGGETALLLHGNPTWSFYWRSLITALRTEHRVIAPDHVGCGLSDKPQDYAYTLEQHIDNLERLVLELDLRDLCLVLHDWGGAIGMGLAARHPHRIRRIVALNTAAFPSPAIPLRIAACRTPLLGPLAVRGLNGFARAAVHMAVERPLDRATRRAYLAPYASWRDRVAVMAFVADIPMEPGHPSWNTLREIETSLGQFRDRPVMLIWGERDWCFTPAFRAEWERRFPEARVHRVEDGGHYIMEDAGEQVIEWVRAFVEESPER